MEPTADGLVEVAADIHPSTSDDVLIATEANGHDLVAVADGDLVLQQMLHALQAVRVGNFTVRLPGDRTGIAGKIADTFNEIVAANERMAVQLERVGQVVGREGKTRQRVKFGLQSGAWGEMVPILYHRAEVEKDPATRAAMFLSSQRMSCGLS